MSIQDTAVLTVTPDGKFIWHENADEMIERGDFTATPAMPHILRRLRQHDQLLEALKDAAQCVQDNYLPDMMGHDWDHIIAKAEGTS